MGPHTKHLSDAIVTLRWLPHEVWVVLALDFLNSYRNFGLRAVQYAYMVNEFGFSDIEAGYWLGVEAWLKVIFGVLGAALVDAIGVRRTALVALTVSVISRGLLAFGRSRESLLFAIAGLTPFGESVLSTGIYTVALKKLTTLEHRNLAFGLQYGIFNLAGALSDLAADGLRQHDFDFGRARWSGLRMHVLVTWVAVLLSLLLTYCSLHDAEAMPLTPLSVAMTVKNWQIMSTVKMRSTTRFATNRESTSVGGGRKAHSKGVTAAV